MKRFQNLSLPKDVIQPPKDLRLTDTGSIAELVECVNDTSDLKYSDFSLQTLINGGATNLLKPTGTMQGSILEQNDAFERVALSTEIEQEKPKND